MIKSFGSKETEKILKGIRSTNIPFEIQQIGRRKLRMINNSVTIIDLRISPSNRLEKREDYHSIRINDQLGIIFKWQNGHSFEVEIIDHHK